MQNCAHLSVCSPLGKQGPKAKQHGALYYDMITPGPSFVTEICAQIGFDTLFALLENWPLKSSSF